MPGNDHKKLHPFFWGSENATTAKNVTVLDDGRNGSTDRDVNLRHKEDQLQVIPSDRNWDEKGKSSSEIEVHPNKGSNNALRAYCGQGTEVNEALHQPSIYHILQPRVDLKLQPREDSRKRRKITPSESTLPKATQEEPQQTHRTRLGIKEWVSNNPETQTNGIGHGKWGNPAINSQSTGSTDKLEHETSAGSNSDSGRTEGSDRETGTEEQLQKESSASTMLVILRYGENDKVRRSAVGQRIDNILRNPMQTQLVSKAAKATHPFFRDRTTNSAQRPSSGVVPLTHPVGGSCKTRDFVLSFSTPGKMRYQAHKRFDELSSDDANEILSRPFNAISFPGTCDPAWPSVGLVNVGREQKQHVSGGSVVSMPMSRAKKKNVIAHIARGESILHDLATRTFVGSSLHKTDNALQLVQRPTRLVMSGSELCRRALKQMEISSSTTENLGHRKFENLLREIMQSMSPFDTGKCEGIPWTQKYMPRSADEVLQPRRLMKVLSSWLEKHIVKSTDTGAMKPSKHDAEQKKHRKKRRRRQNELQDFIIDSDEESESMRGLSDDESPDSSATDNASRSLVRDSFEDISTKGRGRKDNAVLLSGPHGCGKTAAVFAAASELGFEVFEIGPGSTRGGKEILEKVGNMALNHIVSHNSMNHTDDTVDSHDTTLTTPSKSQKKLSAMLRVAPKSNDSVRLAKKGGLSASSGDPKPSSRQKQSLILFEEVDILFDQDKQFWETVMDLAVQSKRPIVMTCTDESVVPKEDLTLHALLRLRPPPADQAAKYLVLLAAAEGHLIHYEAAAALYKLRGFDLRASIAHLNFWCQMAIGDQKGGLEWHLDRWPPGVDLDGSGHKLRIVSEDTLVTGTGILGYVDPNLEPVTTVDEEVLREAWSEFGLEPSQVSSAALTTICGNKDSKEAQSKRGDSSLSSYEFFSDLISATDVFCVVDIPTNHQTQEIQDPTQPPLSESQKTNFTESPRLLRADPLADYSHLDLQASLFLHLGIRRLAAAQIGDSDLRPRSHRSSSPSFRQELTKALLGDHDNQFSMRSATPVEKDVFRSFSPLRDETEISCLDRQRHIIAKDVAPYIRSIAAHEVALERNRQRQFSSTEQNRDKGLRKTRASRSALEGGRREDVRKERWFCKDLDLSASLSTGMREWSQLSFDEGLLSNENENELQPSTCDF